jgi:tetratricopeptide (TPR) repeat protein
VLVGRLSDRTADVTVRIRDAFGAQSLRTVRIEAGRNPSALAALQWARLTLASLAAQPDANKARVRELGKQFGLATGQTSLLVLERVEDYVTHGIEPPPELRAAYEPLRKGRLQSSRDSEAARVAQVVRRFEARVAWWSREFPKDTPPAPLAIAKSAARVGGALGASASPAESRQRLAEAARQDSATSLDRAANGQPTPAAAPAPAAPATFGVRRENGRAEVAKALAPNDGREPPSIGIALAPAAAASEAIRRLRAAPPHQWMRIYLDQRRAAPTNVGFFLEAAEFFLAQGQRAEGLHALSNLAELDLQNRQILRLLAYRLQQAGEIELALPVFERVLELAPNEPQSHRDLGLALAQAGQTQGAVERLYQVVTGAWDARFADVELIALTEMNAVVERSAREGRPVDVSAIDRRLLRNLPVDLRVVLTWDADNTDVDLHVIDPNGDEVFYGRSLSYQGGTITRDATGGYGPEEFLLKDAKPGKYRVEAQFFGHRQQVLTTGTGLMLWLSSGFAREGQRDERATIRVGSTSGERVVVGEFEVKP